MEADTCDFTVPTVIPGFDKSEIQVSREFRYLMLIAKNVKETNLLWYNISRKKKIWGLDENFVSHNQDYVDWLRDLPRDLQITLPSDGAEPWISSHYIAQLHCYHYLSIIMHHRPQIHFKSDAGDPGWRTHMMLCYNSAKSMCRIQEAIIRKYGLEALSCMQRGISFTVYAVLTCTMVHLVCRPRVASLPQNADRFDRLRSPRRTPSSTATRPISSFATCGCWSDACRTGTCLKCTCRSTPSEKHFPLTSLGRSN